MANNVDMGQINWTVKATADQASDSVKKLSNNVSGLSKVLKLVNFTAFIASCKRIGTTIYGLVNQTSQYIQKMNQFKSIMGDSAKEAQNFVDKAERILGLDPEQMMGSLSSFQTLTRGFGIASDEAYKMSKNLTQLAADMSSFTGESMDLALQRIKSGISGEIEPMRKWGIALDQATLQETAYALGINKRVAEMTRAQKTELAYYQIMHATQYAQGNMARTMLTPANAIRILQTEFKQLARAIGSVFIPIALKIIPVVRAIVQILTELARKLAALFGFKISDYDFSASTVQDIGASFGDLEDNVNGTTKALKKMLMPFDELNNVNFDTGGGSGGGIGGVGGGSLGLDTYDYDMFAGATDEVNKKVQQIKDTFEKLKPVVIAVGGILAGLWAIDKIVTFIEWLKRVKAVSNELSTVLQLALVIGGAFLIYKGIKRAIETDWDAKSLLMMIGGTGLIAAAGALKFKSAVPLQIGLGLSLLLGGVWLLYKGVKRAIDMKKIDTKSFLETISGGALASAAGAILFKNPAMFKIGIGLTLAFEGIALEFESVKKMLSGDISLGTILKATGNAFLIGLGVWLLTGSITAGLLVTAGVLAFNLGVQIGMALKNTDWDAIKNNIDKLKEKIKAKFIEFGIDVMLGLIEGLSKMADWIDKTINDIVNGFVNFFKNLLGIHSPSTLFTEFGTMIIQGLINGMQSLFNSVLNVFSKMKNLILETFETIKSNVVEKVTALKDGVINMFSNIKDGVSDKINTIKDNIINGFYNIKNGISNIGNTIRTTAVNIFSSIKDGIVNKINAAKEGVRSAIDRIKGFFNFSWSLPKLKTPHFSWTTKPASGWMADVLKALSLPTSLPKLNVEWYAEGGFPKEGQIFGANENGPELIGNIGRRTAVANQQQITEGISEATYNAFTRALNENKSDDNGSYFVINLEGDAIYNGFAKKENRYSNMYGVKL